MRTELVVDRLPFPIDDGGRLTMPASGDLYCFLNDHPRCYGNNRGAYRLVWS